MRAGRAACLFACGGFQYGRGRRFASVSGAAVIDEKVREAERTSKARRLAKHREAINARRRELYQLRKEDPAWAAERRQQVRDYYRKNLDSERERHRIKQEKRRAEQGERIKAQAREWYRANAARTIEKVRKYKQERRMTNIEWTQIESLANRNKRGNK
jgi:hypothetical protein